MSDGSVVRSDSEAFGGYRAMEGGMSRGSESAVGRMRFAECGTEKSLDLLVQDREIDGRTRLTFAKAPHVGG